MNHLIVFYFLSTLIVGTVSLGIAFFVYWRTKDGAVKNYLLFYTPFSLMVVFYTALAYVETNIPGIKPAVPSILDYFATLSLLSLIFFVPASVHSRLSPIKMKRRNVIFAALAAVVFMAYHIDAFIIESGWLRNAGEYLISSVFIGVMIYCAVVDARYCENNSNPPRGKFERWSCVILGFFIPGLVFDLFLGNAWSFRFYPILYCGYSIFFAASLLAHPAPEYLASSMASPDGDFLEKFNISGREREIVDLVRKGFSNKQIADTLYISLNTVKAHLRNIYPKMGVKGRFELMVLDRKSRLS
jgi:DNA-binding CsgD family transcriptional regulator